LTLVHYVNEAAWPTCQDALLAREFTEAPCPGCGTVYQMSTPLVLELPARDLLVFATPAGDDEGLDDGFHAYLGTILPHLPPEMAEATLRRPYSFVDGLPGLRALLRAFADQPYDQPPERQPAEPEPLGMGTLVGYPYGKLFFYYPDQLPAQSLVDLATRLAYDLDAAGRRAEALELFLGVIDRVGPSHPWLTQEAGRLALEAGLFDRASALLELTERQAHRWLAPTASFLDATPTRRAEDDAEPAGRPQPPATTPRGPVIGPTKHVVTRMRPASADSGVWHFPRMARAACPPDYTVASLLSALAFATASEARARESGVRDSSYTSIALHSATEDARGLLAAPEADPGSFWLEYVLVRWGIDLASLDGAGPDEPRATLTRAAATARAIDRQLAERSVTDFFLESARRHLRTRGYARLNRGGGGPAEPLHRALGRAPERILADCRDAFANAVGLEELIDWFRVFAPVIARVVAGERRAGAGAGDLSAPLTELQAFQETAFDGHVTQGEIDFLRELALTFRQRGEGELADLFDRFVARIFEEGDKSEAASHCHYRRTRKGCKHCGEEAGYVDWFIINTHVRPDLARLVKSGGVLHPSCHYCGLRFDQGSPLLFCNPQANQYLALYPAADEENERRLEAMISNYFRDLPPAFMGNKRSILRASKYVTGWQNADDYAIVSRVTDVREFQQIVSGR
jgi:hypothetical protein